MTKFERQSGARRFGLATLFVLVGGCATHSTFNLGVVCLDRDLGVAFAGEGATDCGLLDIRNGAHPRSLVTSCAHRVAATTKPVRFGFGVVGVDSGWCNVAVRTSDGQWWALNHGFEFSGESSRGLFVGRCDPIAFTSDGEPNRFFELRNCVFDREGFEKVSQAPKSER